MCQCRAGLLSLQPDSLPRVSCQKPGEKSVFGHSLMLLASVLQGESGLEGDSGPPGPDGVKVNLTLMARFSSHAHLHALRPP